MKAIGAAQDHAGAPHLFEVDITELVVVRVGDPADHLVIESWHEGEGVRTTKRA